MNQEKSPDSGVMDYLAKTIEFVMVALTLAMVLLVSYQVFQRYVLHYTPPWSEELSVYLMIWFGIISIAAGVRRGSHMALNYFADLMPKRVQEFLEIFKYILILFYVAVPSKEGIAMVELTMSQKSPAMGLPVGLVYLCLPVSTILIGLFVIEILVKKFAKGRKV